MLRRSRRCGGAAIWAFDFDGAQEWFGSDLEPSVFGKPTVPPGERVISVFGSSILATEADGSNAWQTSAPQSVSGLLPPVVGMDGTVFTADTTGGERWALTPAGDTLYFASADGGIINGIGVSSDGLTFLLAGNNIGEPGFVRAYDATDGSPLWQVTLDPHGGLNEFVHSLLFSFSQDSQTAYFTTRVGGNSDNGRLYALAIGDASPADVAFSITLGNAEDPGDVDGSGAVDVEDLLMLLAQWGSCSDCGVCPADLDGDCAVAITDLLILLANWS